MRDVADVAKDMLEHLDNNTFFLALERMINGLPDENKGDRLRKLGRCMTDIDWLLKTYHADNLRK